MKEKHGRRRLKKAAAVLLAILLLYLCACLCWGPLRYRTFFGAAERIGTYQGLAEGFVPQGMTQDAESGAYLVCGYMDRDEPSRIYVFAPGGDVTCIHLQNTDGSPYEGHAGGMTAAGDYVYISNAHKLFTLRKADVLAAKDGDTLAFRAAVDVPCNASFCSSDDGYVYVGEYHAKGYETDASHALTYDGESFAAFVFAYPVSAAGALAVDAAPTHAFVIPDAVQGFALHNGRAFLSRSAGFHPSSLEAYAAEGDPDGSWSDAAGRELPYYVLGKARLVGAVSAPHMSEDLEMRGGRLLVGYEAGARKAGLGLLPASLRWFAALEPDALVGP